MSLPTALEKWATQQHDEAAAFYNYPEMYDKERIQRGTQVSRQAIPVIRQLLQDDIDASAAASEFAKIWKPHLRDREENSFPSDLWRVVCSAIEHFADDEASGSCGKLAALLLELSKIEERKTDGDLVRTRDSRIFWTDLPLMNLAFYDNLNSKSPLATYAPELTTPSPAKKRPPRTARLSVGTYMDRTEPVMAWSRQLRNGALFQAYWLASYGDSFPKGSPTHVALDHLREALERRHQDTAMGRHRTEHYVAAAVHWILTAGGPLLQCCRDDYGRDGTPVFARMGGDPGTDGYVFSGDDGFYMERWNVWKAAFRRVAATEGIDPHVAAQAAKAAEEMERLDGVE